MEHLAKFYWDLALGCICGSNWKDLKHLIFDCPLLEASRPWFMNFLRRRFPVLDSRDASMDDLINYYGWAQVMAGTLGYGNRALLVYDPLIFAHVFLVTSEAIITTCLSTPTFPVISISYFARKYTHWAITATQPWGTLLLPTSFSHDTWSAHTDLTTIWSLYSKPSLLNFVVLTDGHA